MGPASACSWWTVSFKVWAEGYGWKTTQAAALDSWSNWSTRPPTLSLQATQNLAVVPRICQGNVAQSRYSKRSKRLIHFHKLVDVIMILDTRQWHCSKSAYHFAPAGEPPVSTERRPSGQRT